MRAIVNPYSSRQSWSREVLPEWSLCALPLAGKPYCEHCLDFLLGQEVKSVIVEDCSNYSQSLKTNISVGKYAPMEVQYVGTSMDSSIKGLLMRNTKFIEEDDVLVFWGMVLPEHLADEEILNNLMAVDAKSGTLDDGIYLLRGRQIFRCVLPLHRIDGIQSYYTLNFEMLNDSKGYILPGYSAENGIYIGMNVGIRQNVTITPNVLLGDNINIGRDCVISGDVIICDNAWIDQGTVLKHSIILNHTYVGKEILIENKIVSSGRIIEPISGEYVDDNGGIAMDIRYLGNFDWKMCYEFMIAFLLCVLFFIPYILYLPFHFMLSKRLWTYKLSADRYPKCFKVLCGKARLIRASMNDEIYVFRMADSFSSVMNEEQKEIYDKFYQHNRSCLLITKIVIKGLLSRLFVNAIPQPDNSGAPSQRKVQFMLDNPLLQEVLPQIREEISCLELPKLASVVLGGGYGRDEGGDYVAPDGTHKLYNDLDFFVFTIDAGKKDKEFVASQLESVSKKWGGALDIDVDFSYPKNISEIYAMKNTLMYQELRRGYVVIYGNDLIYTHVPLITSSDLPFIEGMRLLMNRGMGLVFAGEHLSQHSNEYDFILRNINKAILGAMDAILIVCGKYKWRLNERLDEIRELVDAKALPDYFYEMYRQACDFKLKPNSIMPDDPFEHWNKIRSFWCEAVRLCVDSPQDASVSEVQDAIHAACRQYGARSLYNALKWIVRSHASNIGIPGICDAPVMRLLSRIYEILNAAETENGNFHECDPELKRLWSIFN